MIFWIYQTCGLISVECFKSSLFFVKQKSPQFTTPLSFYSWVFHKVIFDLLTKIWHTHFFLTNVPIGPIFHECVSQSNSYISDLLSSEVFRKKLCEQQSSICFIYLIFSSYIFWCIWCLESKQKDFSHFHEFHLVLSDMNSLIFTEGFYVKAFYIYHT